jgi:scyllo-inositol 2-dehydrogenase (NADP+)
MIRVGIVGYGFAGRGFHAYLVNRVPDLRLAAVASRDPDRRARAEREYGVATFATPDEMIEQGSVDLVVVATPHHTHAPLAIAALEAGKDVVVDKVMALNLAEADAMIAAGRRHGRLLGVFQNRRWDWDFLTVKRILAEGLLGAPYLFESAVLRYRGPRGWRAQAAEAGGILFDWGAHLIDQALQLVPAAVDGVTCDIQHRSWGAEIGSYARLRMRFANGVLYDVELGNLARYDRPRWLVLGERGALVKHGLDPQEPAMLAGDIAAARELPEHRARVRTDVGGLEAELVVESARGDWTDYYRNVSDALHGRAELAVKPEEVRRQIAILDAAMESSRTGQTVRPEGEAS